MVISTKMANSVAILRNFLNYFKNINVLIKDIKISLAIYHPVLMPKKLI
jgi:hypothetical protein